MTRHVPCKFDATAPPREIPMHNHLHVALGVQDLERSRRFYESLFGLTADKITASFARFVLADPPLVLSLNAERKVKGGNRLQHFGVRFGSTRSFEQARERLAAAGLIRKEQHRTKCCHAIQEKVWVRDPDGNDWEFYDLIEDLAVPEA